MALRASHWWAPPGLSTRDHSLWNRDSRKLLDHLVGVLLQVTSRPDVKDPVPSLKLPAHPSCCSPRSAASGAPPSSLPSKAPCVLPAKRSGSAGYSDLYRKGKQPCESIRGWHTVLRRKTYRRHDHRRSEQQSPRRSCPFAQRWSGYRGPRRQGQSWRLGPRGSHR